FILVIYIHHPALLSFPPRRSSDLQFTDISAQYRRQTAELQQHLLDKKQFKKWRKAQTEPTDQHKPRLFVVDFNGSMDAREAEALDRKSTRLNSSHVKISYAVFCLK